MCSALAFASSPTDDGPAAGVVSRAARSTASRSQESHPPSSAGPVSAGHPADHASVYESRLPESSPDDPPGTRSLTLPEVPKTTAWLRWLRCPPPPDLLKQRKTLALDSLHGSSVFSVNSPVSVSTIAMVCCFACRSHPTIFISASSVPSLWVRHHKVYSGRREADVVMSSVGNSARRTGRWSVRSDLCLYCSFAHSASASFRTGMSRALTAAKPSGATSQCSVG